jgi:ParB family chromosome partitioning protein
MAINPRDLAAVRGNASESTEHRAPAFAQPGAGGPANDRLAITKATTVAPGQLRSIPLDMLARDESQPRETFDEADLAELARSIKERGLLQAIRARYDRVTGKFVVVVGERRWRAARIAGLQSIEALIIEGGRSPEDLYLDQIAENAHRRDFTLDELGRIYQTLIGKFGWTHERAARETKASQATVTKAVKAHVSLTDETKAVIKAGGVSDAAAYALARVEDPETQLELAERVAAGEFATKEATVEAVNRVIASASPRSKGQGGGRAKPSKLPTSRKFTAGGIRFTAERSRGLDETSLLAALREAVASLESKLGGQSESADGQAKEAA